MDRLVFEGDIEEINNILESLSSEKVKLLMHKIELISTPNEYTEGRLSSLDEMIKDIDDIMNRLEIKEI